MERFWRRDLSEIPQLKGKGESVSILLVLIVDSASGVVMKY